MKKLVIVVMLLVLGAALAAPKLTERAARGETLSDMAEDARTQLGDKGDELFSKIKDYFATHESGEIAEHLRTIFQQTRDLTDEELDREIRAAARGVSLTLSDKQVEWLRKLCRKYQDVDQEKLEKTVDEWKKKASDLGSLEEVTEKLQGATEVFKDATQEAGKLWDSSKDALGNLKDIFQGFAG